MASSSSVPVLKTDGGGGDGGGIGGGETSEAAMIATDQILVYRGLKKARKERGSTAKERISKMPPCAPGKRSSIYRGVTRHRWTGRYEAHLWDKTTWNQNQNKKGKQVYLGAYDDEEAAARAYDLAALKYWGPGTLINFPVTDYTRDLEEMQNVSREDYLASLRRKSSGFSRGLSKYRALFSRWDSSSNHMAAPDYFNSMRYGTGDEAATESEYGFCIDRKIDLTGYIKWWGQNKSRQTEETKSGGCSEDTGGELRTLELAVQPTEPYQMPRLGVYHQDGKNNKVGSTGSAMSFLSQSAAFKSLQEKAASALRGGQECNNADNDENENKNTINRLEYGKAAPVDKPPVSNCGSERLGGISGSIGGLPPLQRNMYPLTPFLSAPLLTNYSSVDPLVDPIMWTPLVPVLPAAGSSRDIEVTKTEISSDYTFFRPDD